MPSMAPTHGTVARLARSSCTDAGGPKWWAAREQRCAAQNGTKRRTAAAQTAAASKGLCTPGLPGAEQKGGEAGQRGGMPPQAGGVAGCSADRQYAAGGQEGARGSARMRPLPGGQVGGQVGGWVGAWVRVWVNADMQSKAAPHAGPLHPHAAHAAVTQTTRRARSGAHPLAAGSTPSRPPRRAPPAAARR